jgi:hypothetical protein
LAHTTQIKKYFANECFEQQNIEPELSESKPTANVAPNPRKKPECQTKIKYNGNPPGAVCMKEIKHDEEPIRQLNVRR